MAKRYSRQEFLDRLRAEINRGKPLVMTGAGSGIGWLLAIVVVGSIREKIQKTAKLPKGLEGPAITLIITGLMSLAFIAFSGMIQIQ